MISGACKWQERQRETDRDWDRERQVREEREGANGEDEERCVQRQRGGVTAVGDDGQETLIMATSTLLLTKEQPSPRHLPRTAFPNPATLRSAPSASLLSILEPPSPTPLHCPYTHTHTSSPLVTHTHLSMGHHQHGDSLMHLCDREDDVTDMQYAYYISVYAAHIDITTVTL